MLPPSLNFIMTMSCGLCLRSITKQATAVQSGAACEHYFHDSCVKIRYCLPSMACAAGKVADTCPVCTADISGVLMEINAKLQKMDAIEGKLDNFAVTMNSIAEQVHKLSTDYGTLQENVKSLEARIVKVENNKLPANVDAKLIEEIKDAAKGITDGSLELRTLQLESQLLADEITVEGFPESADEKLSDIVLLLSNKLKVRVTDNEIVKTERMGAKIPNKNRNIRVKFSSQKFVDSFMNNIKGNIIKVGDLTPDSQSPEAHLCLHRRHPASLYKFRQEIKKKYPSLKLKDIWISFTTVNVRYAADRPPIKLRPSMGLEPLAAVLA